METIKVNVSWSGKNYCGGWGYPEVGAVISTAKTLEELKKEFPSALDFHIQGITDDGESLPEWLIKKEYQIVYELKASALLRQAEQFTTMAALSRVTGINQRLLSNYASEVKSPRPAQLERIINGIREIGQRCIALC